MRVNPEYLLTLRQVGELAHSKRHRVKSHVRLGVSWTLSPRAVTLAEHFRNGHPSLSIHAAHTLLTSEEQQRLATRLHKDFEQGIVWEGKRVQTWIKQEFGKDVYLGRTDELLRAAGFLPQQPRPRRVKGNEEAKEVCSTKCERVTQNLHLNR
ncbi:MULTISPECIES: winged helix-turn-helix domain-containing protein [Deinococcus]|uniref:winged helix-turn-helix domain-containing protein n=1 Tax=Deinococcus TaxID=1298 RepID=UPI0014045CD6|nr:MULTISPECIES: winged helix-turn-helix domain-containing protein [Deinococcus]